MWYVDKFKVLVNCILKQVVDILDESGCQIKHLQSKESQVELLQFKEFKVMSEKHQVFLNEQEVALTGKEFQILTLTAKNKGRVFSKEQIYDLIWGNEYI